MSYIKKEFTFASVSGLADIHCASYLPENGEVKTVLQIAHGMAEHLERYEAFADVLCDNGVAVYINDHLGHGASIKDKNELGYFGKQDGWKHFVEDCHELTKIAKAENPGKPYIFFGHSMGSFVARAYSAKYAGEIDGAIYCGTAGPNPAAGAGIMLTNLIIKLKGDHYKSKLIDKVGFGTYNSKFEGRTAFDWLSRDNFQVDKYIADELCGFLFTAAGYRDLFSLLAYVSSKEWFAGLSKELPVLIISGAMDPVCNYSKGIDQVCDMLKAAGKTNFKKILYPDARHEILNESACFDTVCKDVLGWIETVIK
ncbi:MAG: lysophospholipase [Clostridia bacterium]|nr:lysophospholipase [Clostridia bacterium]MBO7320075.1 lysophospholipase [Clostridia bacterium]